MAAEDLIDIKFRLADGTYIGPNKYSSTTKVASLKEKIISQWPIDKKNGPKMLNNLELINAAKILENNKTIADSRNPVPELQGDVITMYVVIRPSLPDKKRAKLQNDARKKPRCSCSIL